MLGSALAAWVLVAVGGVVRVTASGLGCPHWPLCTANAIPLDQKASFIEYSHRAVVALLIVLVVLGGEGRTHEILQGLHVGGAGTVWAALVALAVFSGDPRADRAVRPLTIVPAAAR